MKIVKYNEFLNENLYDTPEVYVDGALMNLKNKIDKIFDYDGLDDVSTDVNNKTISLDKAKEKGKISDDEKKISFKELNIKLESSEISKYSKLNDSITIKFSDKEHFYNLLVVIPLEEGYPKDKEKNFEVKDIKKCFIKFKKYSKDNFELLGQLSKNCKIKDIDDDFLVDLKIDIDKSYNQDDEELNIETV